MRLIRLMQLIFFLNLILFVCCQNEMTKPVNGNCVMARELAGNGRLYDVPNQGTEKLPITE
jgi:hypothetical protein